MLSIGKAGGGKGQSTAGAARYYEQDGSRDGKPQDEYHTREGLRDSWRWWTSDARSGDARFHRDGAAVERGQLQGALDGQGADGSALTQHGGRDGRQAGWDLTFSAPKSVSALYGAADADTRRGMEQDVLASASAGLRSLQDAGAFQTRRGKGGAEVEAVAEVNAAMFVHATNRDGAPQLHVHAVVPNAGRRQDGTTGALHSEQLYAWKTYAGATFRAELARRMEARGLAVERDGQAFKVRGVPDGLAREWSARRETVAQAAAWSDGLDGKARRRAKESAARATRNAKDQVPQGADLEARWTATLARHGLDREGVWRGARQAARGQERHGRDIGRAALDSALERRSVATERELRRLVAEEAQTAGGGAELAKREADKLLGGPAVVELGRTADGERVFTTRDTLDRERRMLLDAADRAGEASPFRPDAVEGAIAGRPGLSDEQRGAIRHAAGDGGVVAVEGFAGAGKSYTLGAVADAARDSGNRLVAVAPTWQAAKVAAHDTGADARTLQGLLADVGAGRDKLDGRTVVLVDEAGLASSRDVAALLGRAREAGAKVILSGDRGQLENPEPGAAFAAVADQLGVARMEQVRRQDQDWQREASVAFGQGRAVEALGAYDAKGRVAWSEGREDALRRAVDAWERNRAQHPGASRLVMAARNADVHELNARLRGRAMEAGELGRDALTVRTLHSGGPHGRGEARDMELRAGDRLAIGRTMNRDGRDVLRNDLGTLRGFTREADPQLSVRVDRTGRTETFRLSELAAPTRKGEEAGGERLPQLQHGYAQTIYKSQSQTVDYAVVYGGRGLDARQAYVGMTRHRRDVLLVADGGAVRDKLRGDGRPHDAAAVRQSFVRAAGRSGHGGNAADFVADKAAWLRTGDPRARGPQRSGVAIGLNLAGRAVDRTKAAARKLGERLGVLRERETPERQKLRAAQREARMRRDEQQKARRVDSGQQRPQQHRGYGYSARGMYQGQGYGLERDTVREQYRGLGR